MRKKKGPPYKAVVLVHSRKKLKGGIKKEEQEFEKNIFYFFRTVFNFFSTRCDLGSIIEVILHTRICMIEFRK